jgi:hypothetical protein
MIANIALDDGLILPHSATPTGSNFRERQEEEDDDPGEKEAQLHEVVDALARELGITTNILLKIFHDARGDPTTDSCEPCHFNPV